jgi:hypothetical protein
MVNATGFRDFLHNLEALDWLPAGHIDPKLLCLLAELGGEPGLTCAAVISWTERNLSSVCERTVTLVVESPVVRHFSEAFYNESGAPSRFYDFVELHSRLSRDITTLPGGMTG